MRAGNNHTPAIWIIYITSLNDKEKHHVSSRISGYDIPNS